MEKFDTYEKEVHDEVKRQRIDLAKNYRSRKEVVDGVNALFYRIMGHIPMLLQCIKCWIL